MAFFYLLSCEHVNRMGWVLYAFSHLGQGTRLSGQEIIFIGMVVAYVVVSGYYSITVWSLVSIIN